MLVSDEFRWLIGIFGSVGATLLAIWWKIETKQDRKIDDLAKDNSKSHGLLHKKIDEVDQKMTNQHLVVLGKIEEIWKKK